MKGERARDYVIGLIRSRRAMGIVAPRRSRARLPRQLQPDTIRVEYYNAIIANVADMRAIVRAELIPALPEIVRVSKQARGDSVARFDVGGKRVNELLDKASKQFYEELHPSELFAVAEKFGKRTSDFQRKELAKQAKAAIGIDLPGIEPDLHGRLSDFAAENVALIKTIPQQFFGSVEKVVTRAVADAYRAEDIAALIEERYSVSESDAMRIARDQIGKLNGQLNQVRQEALGLTGYTWRGQMDNRERSEHLDREGQEFTWNDPPEDGHPGEPIMCRCFAEPDFSAIFDNL